MPELTPKERMSMFLAQKKLDRIPCVPLILNHAARVLGVKISEYSRNGKIMGRSHAAAFRRYGQDLVTIFTDTAVQAEAMGTLLYYPEDDVARVEKPFLRTPEDVVKLKPADPKRDGRMPVYLEAIRTCVSEVGDRVFVSACIEAPFTTASLLRGTEMFVRDLYKTPNICDKILRIVAENTKAYIDAIVEAGGIPALVDPIASGSVISPIMYEKFALPYSAEAFKRIKKHGFPGILHICGKTHLLVEKMVRTGANVLSLDVIDLEEAKRKVGDKVALMGNVKPAETIYKGTPEKVKAEALECIRKAGDNPCGYILSSGCEVPINSPPENIHALIEAAKQYGKLPLKL